MDSTVESGRTKVGRRFIDRSRPTWPILTAFGLYLAWTVLTWILEGRIRTFLRPAATVDRLVYTGTANLLVGTLVALYLVGRLAPILDGDPDRVGLRSIGRTVVGVGVAGVTGLGLYLAQGAPSTDPVVVGNAFAQVLPVSIAEVVVCWVLVGGTLEAWLRRRGTARVWAVSTALFVSSGLFGMYHLAHSPPFNSPAMIGLLTFVGFGTGLFFFLGRSLYGALVFHNFMALFGVTSALVAGGRIETYGQPVVPLVATAVVAFAVLVAAERRFVRRPLAAHRNPMADRVDRD